MTTFPMVKPPSSLLCPPSLPPSCLWFVTPHPFSHIPNSSHISCFPSSLNTYLSIFTLYQFLPTLFPLFIEILNYLYLVWRIQGGNFGRRGILLTFLHVSIWTQIPCEVKWRTTSFSRMVLSWQAQTLHPLPLWDSPRMSVRKGQPLNPQGTRTSVTYAFFTGGKWPSKSL